MERETERERARRVGKTKIKEVGRNKQTVCRNWQERFEIEGSFLL